MIIKPEAVQLIKGAVDEAIDGFKTDYPQLYEKHDETAKYRIEAYSEIDSFVRSAKVLDKTSLVAELEKYYNAGVYVFNLGQGQQGWEFSNDNYAFAYQNIMIGMIQISWIKELLQVIDDIAVPAKTEQMQLMAEPHQKTKYSLKQIAIACYFLKINLDLGNATQILSKYSTFTSAEKLLQKRVYKASDLTCLTENKTSDSKHLKDLEAAKRLVSGKKNKKANDLITSTIAAFQVNFNKHYK